MKVDEFGFLSLVVALSAYIASIRLAVIGRLGSTPAPRNPTALKRFLFLLIPADAPLVLSGILIALHLFSQDLFGTQPASWLAPASIKLFFIAIVVLAIHHFSAWVISINKLCRACNAGAQAHHPNP